MLVTALEPRRKRLTALFLDGELAAKLDSETLLQSGLRIGVELDDEELHRLIQRSDAHRAQEKALYLLEHRSHSKKELADKISRTAGREAAERAAERMEELGLVNDAQYARNLAEELLQRKRFAARRAELSSCKRGSTARSPRKLWKSSPQSRRNRSGSCWNGSIRGPFPMKKGAAACLLRCSGLVTAARTSAQRCGTISTTKMRIEEWHLLE